MPAAKLNWGPLMASAGERCAISHCLLNSNPTVSSPSLHKGATGSRASGSSSASCQPMGKGSSETERLRGRSTGTSEGCLVPLPQTKATLAHAAAAVPCILHGAHAGVNWCVLGGSELPKSCMSGFTALGMELCPAWMAHGSSSDLPAFFTTHRSKELSNRVTGSASSHQLE